MENSLSKEEFWKIYNNLPADLKDSLFSPDTEEVILNISQICNIDDISLLAKLIGDVLIGLLPPKEFKNKAQKKFGLEDANAQRLETYVQHYVFNPVADDLEVLYGETKKKEKEEPLKEEREDAYREIIQ